MLTEKQAILILGGSEMAYQLAKTLQNEEGLRVISSLAGRTKNPRLPAGEWRIGGFGGVEGLVKFLHNYNIRMMIDATHPFARNIKANALKAARLSGVSLLRLQHPPWQQQIGDYWIEVDDENQAAAILPMGATVFLALGRQHLHAFRQRQDVNFIARMIEKPDNFSSFSLEQFPKSVKRFSDKNCGKNKELEHSVEPNETKNALMKIILDRPKNKDQEIFLLRNYKVDYLVCRNSGAQTSYAKIAAARDLSLPVVMITPSPLGESIPTVINIQAALNHIRQFLNKG